MIYFSVFKFYHIIVKRAFFKEIYLRNLVHLVIFSNVSVGIRMISRYNVCTYELAETNNRVFYIPGAL